MPTLVRVAASADQSASDDNTTMDVDESIEDPDDSSVDESVNMLLDNTIHSESDSDSDSAVEADRKPTKRSDPTGSKNKTEKDSGDKRNESFLVKQINAGSETSRMEDDNGETRLSDSNSYLESTERKPNRMDDENDETRLSDSNSSIDAPERTLKYDKQSSCGRQANSTVNDFQERQGDDRHEHHGKRHSHGKEGANDESRTSDSDSFLDSPPRRSTKLHHGVESIQSECSRDETPKVDNDETRLSEDNDETRMSDGNDETRLEYSFQDARCSRPNQVENTSRRPESEQEKKLKDSEGQFHSRRPSPQELEWRQQKDCHEFRSKFKKTVSDFERRYPRVKLRDYQTLSSEEQTKEQHKVVNLLDRLGIRSKSQEEEDPINSNLNGTVLDTTCLQDHDMPTTRIEESPLNTQRRAVQTESLRRSPSPRKKSSTEKNASSLQQKRATPEAVELSPIAGATSPNFQSKGDSPNFRADSPIFTGGDSVSELSVEITRGANHDESMSPYKSPQLHISDRSNSKRLASTSGKRGKDAFRVKLNETSRAYMSDSDDPGVPLPAPSFHSSDDSLSMVSAHSYEPSRGQPFSASQSPITGADRRSDRRSQRYPTQRQRQSYREDSRAGRHGRRSPSQETYSARRRSPSQESYSARHRSIDRSSRRQDASSSRRRDDTANNSRHRREKRSSHRREKHSDEYAYDDTIDTVNAAVFRDHERRPRLRDKTNVQLKEGVPFHYNPLQIKRTKRTSRGERTTKDCPRHRAVDFRDPLSEYVGEEGEELYHVFEWMRDRDNARKSGKWRSDSKGIVFSLEASQIVNVTLKLLLENMDREREDKFEDITSLSGQTLIVVRTKEEIATWEHAFREHTPLTVQNHAELPSSKRKRAATASECATFDIVITTFDALKGLDSTVQMDDSGHVILGEEAESQGGWMTKRLAASSGASQRMGGFTQRVGVGACGNSQRVDSAIQCKQLSVLHRLQWRRIIFTDDLGRKCFLAKQGTAKAQAAAAVNGRSRFVFFSKEREDISSERSAFESLMRSDKRATQSVAAVLHLRSDDEDEELFDVMLDPAQGI